MKPNMQAEVGWSDSKILISLYSFFKSVCIYTKYRSPYIIFPLSVKHTEDSDLVIQAKDKVVVFLPEWKALLLF